MRLSPKHELYLTGCTRHSSPSVRDAQPHRFGRMPRCQTEQRAFSHKCRLYISKLSPSSKQTCNPAFVPKPLPQHCHLSASRCGPRRRHQGLNLSDMREGVSQPCHHALPIPAKAEPNRHGPSPVHGRYAYNARHRQSLTSNL